MTVSIANFSVSMLNLCMMLSTCAYTNDFKQYKDEIIYRNLVSKISQPVFYVLEHGDALFVVTRGSQELTDFQTLLAMDEIGNEVGSYHEGMYKAALYVKSKIERYVKSWNGPIYFTGHSYGGAVSGILTSIFLYEYPFKDINSIGFGSVPVMSTEANKKIKKSAATIISGYDLIPTLSVPNIYQMLLKSVDDIEAADNTTLRRKFIDLLDGYYIESVPAGKEIVYSLKQASSIYIDNVIEHMRIKKKEIQHPPGSLYKLSKDFSETLENSEVDPEDLSMLSTSKFGIADHPPHSYFEAIDNILE